MYTKKNLPDDVDNIREDIEESKIICNILIKHI